MKIWAAAGLITLCAGPVTAAPVTKVWTTMADFAAVLRAVRSAGRVYLGWGVDLDGDDLPIGVNPGLRVRVSTEK